jgi:hypothetical protein
VSTEKYNTFIGKESGPTKAEQGSKTVEKIVVFSLLRDQERIKIK